MKSVADRNGSLETNESSSPEASQHSDHEPNTPSAAAAPDFDFNQFFQIANIPGLNVSNCFTKTEGYMKYQLIVRVPLKKFNYKMYNIQY